MAAGIKKTHTHKSIYIYTYVFIFILVKNEVLGHTVLLTQIKQTLDRLIKNNVESQVVDLLPSFPLQDVAELDILNENILALDGYKSQLVKFISTFGYF